MLYQLPQQLQDLAEMLENAESTEELEAIQNCLTDLKLEAAEGVEYLCKAIANTNAKIGAFNAEIERLSTAKTKLNRTIDNAKGQIKGLMLAAGVKNVSGLFTVTLAEGSESVDVQDSALIPDEFMTVKVVQQPDKTAIKAAIKSGQLVAGAALVRGEKQVRIK